MKMQPERTAVLAGLLAAGLMISGCGGDDGARGGAGVGAVTAPGGTSGNTPGGNGTVTAGRFEFTAQASATTPEAFSLAVDALGDQGYRFANDEVFDAGNHSLAVRDTANPTTWTFRTVPLGGQPVTAAALESLLASQGTDGFRFRGLQSVAGSTLAVFVKDDESSEQYEYELLEITRNANDFVIQANSRGAAGYRYTGTFILDDGDLALYRRIKGSSEALVYATDEPSASPDAFVAQANARGADGFRYRGDIVFAATGTTRSIYVRDTSRTGTLEVAVLDVPETLAATLEQANAEGAAGRLRIGQRAWLAGGSPVGGIVYFNLNRCNCNGIGYADPFVD